MKYALVTGGNRGLGLEIVRQLAQCGFTVFMGMRNISDGTTYSDTLNRLGSMVHPVHVDVNDHTSLSGVYHQMTALTPVLDVLVNNAAINLDGGHSIIEVPAADLQRMLQVNLLGVLETTQTFWPLLEKAESPRIINVSSGAGQLSTMLAPIKPHLHRSAYALTKTALNALTCQLAATGGEHFSVNAVNPGWMRTDMGGPNAPLSPEQGAKEIVRLATMENPPTGRFFQNGTELPW